MANIYLTLRMEMAVKEIAHRLNRVGCDLEELQPQEIPEPSV